MGFGFRGLGFRVPGSLRGVFGFRGLGRLGLGFRVPGKEFSLGLDLGLRVLLKRSLRV